MSIEEYSSINSVLVAQLVLLASLHKKQVFVLVIEIFSRAWHENVFEWSRMGGVF